MLKQVQHDGRGRARLYWPLAKSVPGSRIQRMVAV
jgi:hypothetical protein